MAKNAQNIKIGECDVFYNGEVIGHTKGGVEFSFEREFEDLTVDQYGSMALDKALTGEKLQVKVFIAEPTKENLAYSIPEGRYDYNGEEDNKLGLGRDAGYLLSQDAVELRLHPRNETDTNNDIYIWKAVSVEAVELAYKVDEQRILEVTFEALVDETRIDGYRLGRIGDDLIS